MSLPEYSPGPDKEEPVKFVWSQKQFRNSPKQI